MEIQLPFVSIPTGQATGAEAVTVGPSGMARSDTELATTLHHEYEGHVAAVLNGTHPGLWANSTGFEAALNIDDAGFAARIGDSVEAQYRINNAAAAIDKLELMRNGQ